IQQILRHSPPLTPLYPILYLTEPFINYHGSGDGEADGIQRKLIDCLDKKVEDTGRVGRPEIQTVSGVVLTLDCVRVWECALRYHTEQQIQSGQKPEQLQLEESLLTDYRRWLVGTRAITAALHTLHNWEIDHYLPNACPSACDAHSKELISQFSCFAYRIRDQILTSRLEQVDTIPADIFIRSKEIVKMYKKDYCKVTRRTIRKTKSALGELRRGRRREEEQGNRAERR
ncbi:hypothetical protein I352_06535, partial [Cryptococcus deuterogattii MMRL2647]